MPAKIGMNFVSSRSKGISTPPKNISSQSFSMRAGSASLNFAQLNTAPTGCSSCGH